MARRTAAVPGNGVRPALPDEAEELTRLCIRSKAHWGYDADFMRLSRPGLTVTPAMIAEHRVLVAEDPDAGVLGVAKLDAPPEDARYDLALMFVAPEAMGRGIGRRLFDGVVDWLRARGARRLEILADPNAAPFYEGMGAVRIGDAPSDAIPGRRLPLYEYRLPPEGD